VIAPRLVTATLAAALAAGCAPDDYAGTHFACAVDQACPPGQACVLGACYADDDAPCAVLDDFEDDFEPSTPRADWNNLIEGHATIAAGTMTLPVPAMATGDTGLVFSDYTYDVTGRGVEIAFTELARAETKLTLMGNSGIAGDPNRYAQVAIGYDRREGVEGIYALVNRTLADGTYDQQRALLAAGPEALTHRWWRIVDDGASFRFAISSDHLTWEERSLPVPAWFPRDAARVVILTQESYVATADTVVIDALRVIDDRGVLGRWCPASSVAEDFAPGVATHGWRTSPRDGATCDPRFAAGGGIDLGGDGTGSCALLRAAPFDLTASTMTWSLDTTGLAPTGSLRIRVGYDRGDTAFARWELRADGGGLTSPRTVAMPVDARVLQLRDRGDGTVELLAGASEQALTSLATPLVPSADLGQITFELEVVGPGRALLRNLAGAALPR
jgi:hypothetical protein